MIESGNVVCACVPVCVLIKGCSTRYDIIPQIKNRANSKLRQNNHNNRSSDELVFLVVGKEDKGEKEEKQNHPALGSSELTRIRFFTLWQIPRSCYVQCHSDKLASWWFWQNRWRLSGPVCLLADLLMSQATTCCAWFPLKHQKNWPVSTDHFGCINSLSLQQTPVWWGNFQAAPQCQTTTAINIFIMEYHNIIL